MNSAKVKTIFIIFLTLAPFLCVTLLFAEPKKPEIAVNSEISPDEVAAPADTIEIKQVGAQSAPSEETKTAQDKPRPQRKSILYMGDKKEMASNLTQPGVVSKPGWKTKTVQAPQPVDNMVKEVPLEVKAKRERMKAKLLIKAGKQQ